MAIEDFNGSRSIVIDEIERVRNIPPTVNSVLIIGTGSKGAINQLTVMSDGNVTSTFGDIPNDPSFDTNIGRHYYEINQATVNGTSVFGIRVGDAKKAKLTMYEAQMPGAESGYGTGDTAPSSEYVSNTLQAALISEALVEGADANNGAIIVGTDESGIPNSIIFRTPDEVERIYALDPYGKNPNALSNVREVAYAINQDPDWSKWYVTRYPVMRIQDLPVTVKLDTNGAPYIEVSGGTYGDKMETLNEIAIEDPNAVSEIPLGVTTYRLDYLPKKDTSGYTRTITRFNRHVVDDSVLIVSSALVSGTVASVTPFFARSNARWTGLDIAFITDSATLKIAKPNGNRITVPQKNGSDETIWEFVQNEAGNWVLSIDLSKFTVQNSFQMSDVFYLSYAYPASYSEADLRSQIEIGNEFSYFIKGDEIIFGASQSLPVDAVYPTRKIFDVSDLNVTDDHNIVIYFVNPENAPAAGEDVLVSFTHLPELPAKSGQMLTLPKGGTVIQRSGFSGGDDGRNISKLRYKQLVSDALDLVELYPFKQIFIAGAYLDDVEHGYDDETGHPALVAVDWGSLIVPKIRRRSWLVKECTMNIPVRLPTDYSTIGVKRWFDRLTINDPNDVGRPANMIDALRGPDSFRINVIAGVPLGANGKIKGGTQYAMNPAAVYTGMKQDLGVEYTHTHALLPGSVHALGVSILNAEIIGNVNARRFTFFTEDSSGNKMVADAPTAAQAGSSYDRQFVVDAVFAAIEIVRATAERFIGLPRSQGNILAMKNKCQRKIGFLVPSVFGRIEVNVLDVPDGSITGKVKLGIVGETSREIRVIDVETRISLV